MEKQDDTRGSIVTLRNKYILYLAASLIILDILLALLDTKDLGIYYSLNFVAYFVIRFLYDRQLGSRVKRWLNTITVILLAGFLLIVVREAMDIISIMR